MTTHNDGLVIHMFEPYYHNICDRTFTGYTAHYCPTLMPRVAVSQPIVLEQRIETGDTRES